MDLHAAPATPALIASALRWWRDAGLDVMIDEAPCQWLAQPVSPSRGPERAPEQNGHRTKPLAQTKPQSTAPLPATRDALVAWLATAADVAEGGPPARRVLPSGDPSSSLMVLVDLPDIVDIDAGHLLAGDLEALFDNMLTAIRRDRSTIYLASIAPGRPATGRLNEAALAALAPIARRHVELVAPEQLWLLGTAASRAILGISDLQAHEKLHSINLNGRMIEVVVTAHPRFLTTKEKKHRAWTEMQRLLHKDMA